MLPIRVMMSGRAESIQTRIKIIRKFYALLEKNKLPMTKLISTETGKTHADAASEVAATLAKLNNSILAYKKRTGSERNSLGSCRQVFNMHLMVLCRLWDHLISHCTTQWAHNSSTYCRKYDCL